MVKHNWGGIDYSMNNKPVTGMFFNQQIKSRDGEYFKTIRMK